MADCLIYEYRPARLYVNLTNECTNTCIFCARSYQRYSLGRFDLRLLRQHQSHEYIAQLRQQVAQRDEVAEVVFCGFGEPTLRLDTLLEVGSWAKQMGLQVRLNTNGQAEMIHDRDVVSALSGVVDRVNVSLNAPDAEAYARVSNPRAGQEAWRWVVGFLRRCRIQMPESRASIVGTVLSPEEISATRQLCSSLGIKLVIR